MAPCTHAPPAHTHTVRLVYRNTKLAPTPPARFLEALEEAGGIHHCTFEAVMREAGYALSTLSMSTPRGCVVPHCACYPHCPALHCLSCHVGLRFCKGVHAKGWWCENRGMGVIAYWTCRMQATPLHCA